MWKFKRKKWKLQLHSCLIPRPQCSFEVDVGWENVVSYQFNPKCVCEDEVKSLCRPVQFFHIKLFFYLYGPFFCSHVGMGRSPPLSLKLKDPCPVAIKQPHTIILPSPNFKTGTMQSVKMHFLMWSTVLMQLFIIIHRFIGIYWSPKSKMLFHKCLKKGLCFYLHDSICGHLGN